MLGYTLADMNQLEEAITVFAEAYPADELPIFSQKGPDFHYRWILTHMRLGEKHYDNGEVEIADGLWAQAVAYGRHISIRQPNTRIQHLVGIGLQAMGRYEEAIDIIEESLLREDDPAHERELRQALDKLYTLRKEAP